MNSYIQTLEDLAGKRRKLTDVIVNLAAVAGVDAAAYLDTPAAVTDADVDRVTRGLKVHAQEKPPRPQLPASRTTNGAGRAHKVEGELPAEILLALQKHGEPMQPKDLAKAMKKSWSTLAYHIKKLEKAKQIVLSGSTFDRRVALA